MERRIGSSKKKSIKARMLAIALIPSLVLLLFGLVISGYLVNQGVQTYRWADNLRAAVAPGTGIVGNLQVERWLSLVRVGGGTVDQRQLNAQRGKVNADLYSMESNMSGMPALAGIVPSANTPGGALWNRLGTVRQQIDAGHISLLETYDYYDQLLAPIANYVGQIADQAPSAQISDAQLTAAEMYSAAEDVARANALAFAAAFRGGMNGPEFGEYARQVGAYQSALGSLSARMTPAEQQRYTAMTASPAWQQLVSVQTKLSATGPNLTGSTTAHPLAVSQLDWQNDTIQVMAQMLVLFNDHFNYAANLAASDGKTTLISALIAGLVILLAGVVVLVIAVRMSNGVSRRLVRLREDTLDIAEEHLPRLVNQLRSGSAADPAPEIPVLQHGDDEIGQVAEAFNKAQHTAVAAAVSEVKTRQGANSVFLNIAHRSQLVAQRQLSVLDLAESRQEDPQQIQFLFQLDHLATRARRNAENLIILGGKRPARQWRDAVPIRDVVRSAIGETEHFARIKILRLPNISIVGPAVGDVVHLLAELLDNATSFAPPEARAELSGTVVGRGLLIEIDDQGLGIPVETRDNLNAALLTPPDYGVLALTTDSRLGLFVVARLAARHGIRVALTDSIYGGTRAVVLLPTALTENPNAAPQTVIDETSPVAQPIPLWPPTEPVDDVDSGQNIDGGPSTDILPPVVPAGMPQNGNGHNGNAYNNNGHNGNGHNNNGHNNDHNGHNGYHGNGQNGNGQNSNGQNSNGQNGIGVSRQPMSEPPPLPRRRRRASLAPQLAVRPFPPRDTEDHRSANSAEQMRVAVSAFQRGTQRGRHDGDRGMTTEE